MPAKAEGFPNLSDSTKNLELVKNNISMNESLLNKTNLSDQKDGALSCISDFNAQNFLLALKFQSE